MSLSEQYCTFVVDGLLLGVPVACVQEVMRQQRITVVPHAPAVIAGLLHLRGQIVTAIDLRQRLKLPPRAAQQAPMNIVVSSGNAHLSLQVDEIGDVIEVDKAWFEPAPETLSPELRVLIQGAFKLPGRLLLVLDAERVCQALGTEAAMET